MLEPGTYEATLEKITAWVAEKYKSTDLEPSLVFHWNFGEDENGNAIRMRDRFVNIPLDNEGYPFMPTSAKARLYNRSSALFGERFDAKTVEFSFDLPERYDSLEGMLNLPHVDEAKQDGFRPIEMRTLSINGVNIVGRTAMVVLAQNGDYVNITEATPVPRKPRGLNRAAPATPPAPASAPIPTPADTAESLPF